MEPLRQKNCAGKLAIIAEGNFQSKISAENRLLNRLQFCTLAENRP
jgi:hypothetical protein